MKVFGNVSENFFVLHNKKGEQAAFWITFIVSAKLYSVIG